MSNFLAVATVTAVLSEVLQAAVGPDVPGATVTTFRPDGNGATMPAPGANVFLYLVTTNPAWQSADLPTRRPGGDLVLRPQAALDLHYLLTFYGDEAQLEPQRVLGSAVRALHSRPVLTRDVIRQTIGKPNFSFLAASNLADSVELVKFTPLSLSLEELSKLWSVYFQTPYNLSVAYMGTVVLIESEESARASLPVRARNIYVVPFRHPLIEEVFAEGAEGGLITPTSTLVVTGKRLRGEVTRVRVGGVEVAPAAPNVSDTRIRLPLPSGLRAGVQGVQVVHPALMGTPPAEHRGVESNLAAFVLHPTIKRRPDESPDITVPPPAVAPDGTRSADVTVGVSPAVGKSQRASLLMNELDPPAGRAARAYSFDAVPRNQPADPAETETLVFRVRGVAQGDYLVRLQVDGAESPLKLSADPDDPLYVGPKVTIP
ncbi:MAG TPA: DUF4255 domain-containing protein [Pyrinomonadaceae bacterium]|nr:DUF4255 domain-containing protein [Pyrinomonadaceae bacterium]